MDRFNTNYDLDEARDKNGAVGDEHQAKNTWRTALPQILAIGAKNILLLAYGMTLGFPTIAIPALLAGGSDELTLTKDEISWFSSINLICVPIGCLASGALTDRLGRKRSMMIVNLPIIAAWIIFHFAHNVAMLYTSLVLTGLSGGLLEAPVLTYVAEITTPQLRGMLSATSSMSVILGIFLQFLMGSLLGWRTVALVNVIFPLAAFISLCFVPESPVWLICKARLNDAERSLCWLRGWRQPSEVHVEFTALVTSIASSITDDRPTATWRNYTHHSFLKPYLVVSAAFFIGHFAGITTLQTFAIPIFQALGSPVEKYIATLYLGLAQLAGSLVCVILVHWTGKRPLSFVSTLGNGVCIFVVASYAYMSTEKATYNVEGYSWVPLVFLLLAAFMSHIGIRLLPWILIGEVFPHRVRSFAAGASSSIGYIFGFLVNKVYVYMIEGMTLAGTFCFYGTVSILGALYLYYYLPETEGRTLFEIEEHFDGKVSLLKSGKFKRKFRDSNEIYKRNNGGIESQM